MSVPSRGTFIPAAIETAEIDATATVALEIPPGAGDDDAPQWPDEAAEVVFLSEQRSDGSETLNIVPQASERATQADPPEIANSPLPSLQTLVDRIPADARDVLEDLFRARFVSVKRVQSSTLK